MNFYLYEVFEEMKRIVVTGCKPMELSLFSEEDPRIEFIKKALEKRIIGLIEEGLEWVMISGQMGVEMWAAEVVLDLKEEYDIQIAMMPPFENMQGRWPEPLQMKYEALTFSVDFYQPIYNGDYKGPFQFKGRDQFLIEKTDGCLILMDEDNPGSVSYFLEAAKGAPGYPILTITPNDLDDVIEEIRMSDPDYWN